jgi:uncharacterized protein YdaU (DUF1376 family)
VNYYERHLGDYARDTGHLTMLEHGAYGLLLDRYYATEQGLPVDDVLRLARARTKEERAAVNRVLKEFFVLREGVWVHEKCDRLIVLARVKIDAARVNGSRGGRPKKPKGSETETQEKPSGFHVGSENETQTKAHQAPDTNHQVEQEQKKGGKPPSLPRPESVSESTWADWLSLRKAKKAPVTGTVVKQAAAEAAKAGMPLEDFLQVWCARGSQGLEADWLKPNERARAGPSGAQPVGKTMQGLMTLEALKNGLADSGSGDRNPALVVSEPRRLPGR